MIVEELEKSARAMEAFGQDLKRARRPRPHDLKGAHHARQGI